MSDELSKTEIRMRSIEVAQHMVHQPYISSANGIDSYRDKDIREALRIADRIVAWVTETEAIETSGLISKLRDALCDKSA